MWMNWYFVKFIIYHFVTYITINVIISLMNGKRVIGGI